MTSKLYQLQGLSTTLTLQELFDAAYRILGLPALMHDMEYNIIAYARGVSSDDPIWNEYITAQHASPERLTFLKNESFIEAAANATDIVVLKSPKLRHDRIFGKLFNAEMIQVGCVCMLANEHFLDGEAELFAVFCEKINAILAQMEAMTAYGQHYRNHLIAALIDSEIDDKAIYSAHIESIYIGLWAHLRLVVVDGISESNKPAAFWMEQLKRKFSKFRYALYRDKLLVLASSPHENDTSAAQRLCDDLESNGLRVAISPSFCNLYDLRQIYHALG